MPSSKAHASLLTSLAITNTLSETSLQVLSENYAMWRDRVQKTSEAIEEKFRSKFKSSKEVQLLSLELRDHLQMSLSDKISEKDLHKIILHYLLAHILFQNTSEEKKTERIEINLISKIAQKLQISEELLQTLGEVDQILKEQFGKEIGQQISYSLLQSIESPLLNAAAIQKIVQLHNYILKRTLAKSINDEGTQLMLINTHEVHWGKLIIDSIEKDKQPEAQQNRLVSLNSDITNFLFQEDNNDPTERLYWLNALNILGQGHQTSIFNTAPQQQSISQSIHESSFTSIILDLRKASVYSYEQKSIPAIDQTLSTLFQELKLLSSVNTTERYVFWAYQKLEDLSMLTLLIKRDALESKDHHSLRKLLEYLFQEVLVVDFQDDEEGMAVIYLFKKAKPSAKKNAQIQYAFYSLNKLSQSSQSFTFDTLNWLEVYPQKQNYWLGIQQKEFFNHIPLWGSDVSIFEKTPSGVELHLTYWLMDLYPKQLEKKVRHVLKAYQKLKSSHDFETNHFSWPKSILALAEQGVKLEFDKSKIEALEVSPFTTFYFYADENLGLLSHSRGPAFAYDHSSHTLSPLMDRWKTDYEKVFSAFPYQTAHNEDNISDEAVELFKNHYQQKTKAHDHTFIVFPPEQITSTLHKIEMVSKDLPVIKKYPNQIGKLLEEAKHFTLDVELLTPPYEKIDEFKRKVLRLEKDAIERKVIYQKVKIYIEELKGQLARLTQEHDEAVKDYEAINKENIFYYTYAVLLDPSYAKRYTHALRKELPRIPFYPSFRKWAAWGKEIFDTYHQKQKIIQESRIQWKLEEEEQSQSKSFKFQIEEERNVILLKEGNLNLTISNIPATAWQYKYNGTHPITFYLNELMKWHRKNRRNTPQFSQPLLQDPQTIVNQIKFLSHLAQTQSSLHAQMKTTEK